MEAIKNYVIVDDCYDWIKNKHYDAIPEKYKTLNLFILYGRVDGADNALREDVCGYGPDDTLLTITDALDNFCGEAKGKDRMLIIKWLFSLCDDEVNFDIETGEWSRPDEEEEEEDLVELAFQSDPKNWKVYDMAGNRVDEEEEVKSPPSIIYDICGVTGGKCRKLDGCQKSVDAGDTCMIDNTSFCIPCYEKWDEENEEEEEEDDDSDDHSC
jgi:hypothetical protein